MIVLINTPLKLNEYSFTSIQYPINLGYLASYLQKNNFEVQIWDYGIEKFTEEKFIQRIKEVNPKVIGFSCITPNIIGGGKLAELVKKNLPSTLTVVGGPHCTALPERTLKEFPDFDIGVVGEGEETIVELLRVAGCGLKLSTLNSVKGIIYREDEDIIKTEIRPVIENIDAMPFPNRDLVNANLYIKSHPTKIIKRKDKKIIEIITSRGCPFNCFFCAGHNVFQYKTRIRSVENVLGEVDAEMKKYNINHLTILDNTFTLDEKRTTSLCDEFKKRKLTFDCNSRIDTVSKYILEKMAKNGCIKISFGIESGSDRVLKLIDKKTNTKQIKETINYARKSGIEIIEGTAIIGAHPTETKDETRQTVNLLKNLDLDYVVVDIIVPYPGSPTHQYMKEKGLILSENWNKFVPYGKKPCWRTENFSPQELVKTQRKAMLSFYFRPKVIYKKLKRVKSMQDLIYYLRIVFDFLFKR